jgi:hypothetical protein
MAALTPAERSLRGRIGAYRLHALRDTLTVSAPGRAAATAALDARLKAEVDPDGLLSPEELAKRVERARRAHFASLALRRSPKRTAKQVARRQRSDGDSGPVDALGRLLGRMPTLSLTPLGTAVGLGYPL